MKCLVAIVVADVWITLQIQTAECANTVASRACSSSTVGPHNHQHRGASRGVCAPEKSGIRRRLVPPGRSGRAKLGSNMLILRPTASPLAARDNVQTMTVGNHSLGLQPVSPTTAPQFVQLKYISTNGGPVQCISPRHSTLKLQEDRPAHRCSLLLPGGSCSAACSPCCVACAPVRLSTLVRGTAIRCLTQMAQVPKCTSSHIECLHWCMRACFSP